MPSAPPPLAGGGVTPPGASTVETLPSAKLRVVPVLDKGPVLEMAAVNVAVALALLALASVTLSVST